MGCRGFYFVSFLIIFLIGFVGAGHNVLPSSVEGDVSEPIELNISVENTDAGNGTDITSIEVSLPSSCSLESNSQGTSSSGSFSGSGDSFSWSDSSLILESETHYFWFDFVCSSAGDDAVVVSTTNSSGTYENEIGLEVNAVDAGNPIASFVSPNDDYSTDDDSVLFKFKCTDDSGVSSIRLYTNTQDEEWQKEFENTSYVNGTENSFRVEEIYQGSYVWAVSCTDNKENVDWTTNRSFYITGAGTTNQTFFWDYSFSITSSQLEKGYTKDMLAKRKIIFYFDKSFHYVGLVEIKNNSINVEVASDPVQADLGLGETKYFDINNDSIYDVAVTLNSINNLRATITILQIEIPFEKADILVNESFENNSSQESLNDSEENLEEETNNSSLNEGENSSSLGGSFFTFIIIVVVVLLIIFGFVFYKLHNKKTSSYGEQEELNDQ